MKTTDPKTTHPTPATPLDAITEDAAPDPSNDNATDGGVPDTTHLVARADVVRYLRATLCRHGVALHELADAIAEVQLNAIESARTRRMPADPVQWKALTATIAGRWAIDRHRETVARAKYDAGLCEDPDAYERPTLHWEERDPVDTKRYLTVLKELFDSGQMPEDGAEILWGEAEQVPHAEIAAEVGVTETVVRSRLFRMRKTFRARLVALGLLTLLLLLVAVLYVPLDAAPAPAPPTQPAEPASPPARCEPVWDAGRPISEKSSSPVKRNRALSD
jgi:DNA-directed RNA polymerase specialized sigma24 family protein